MPSSITSTDLKINSFTSLDLYNNSNVPPDGVDANGRLNINLLTIDGMEDGFIEKPSSSTSGNIAVFNSSSNCIDGGQALSDMNAFVNYVTTAPTAANTNGLKVCVLSSEPSTKYNGWLYIITE